MDIKVGDIVELKSLVQVLKENEIVEYTPDKCFIFKGDDKKISAKYYKYFGDNGRVSYIGEDFLELEIDSCSFEVEFEWIDKVILQKNNCWEIPREDNDTVFTLKSDGEIKEIVYNDDNWYREYNQGNICSDKKPLSFLKIQRRFQFAVRKFMEENNTPNEDRYWQIVMSIDNTIDVNHDFNITTEWRFSNGELARECLDLIGENNWRNYILGIEKENTWYDKMIDRLNELGN